MAPADDQRRGRRRRKGAVAEAEMQPTATPPTDGDTPTSDGAEVPSTVPEPTQLAENEAGPDGVAEPAPEAAAEATEADMTPAEATTAEATTAEATTPEATVAEATVAAVEAAVEPVETPPAEAELARTVETGSAGTPPAEAVDTADVAAPAAAELAAEVAAPTAATEPTVPPAPTAPAETTVPAAPIAPAEPTVPAAPTAPMESSAPAAAPSLVERAPAGERTLYERLWETGLPNVAALAQKELTSLFLTPIGYVAAALSIVVTSLFAYLPQINGGAPVSMASVFNWLALMSTLFIPIYTMRLLAEEQRSGTLEQLMTSPIRFWELVVGKWLGCWLFFVATLVPTLAYVVLISVYQQLHTPASILGLQLSLPNVDYGSIFTGYVGIVLLGGAWIAMGLLASSLTQNQIIAAILGFAILLFIQYGVGVASGFAAPPASDLFSYISASERTQSFNQGQLALRDIVYFATLTIAALFVTVRVVESRKWR